MSDEELFIKNVGELKEILNQFPDKMPVGLVDHHGIKIWLRRLDVHIRDGCGFERFLGLYDLPEPDLYDNYGEDL